MKQLTGPYLPEMFRAHGRGIAGLRKKAQPPADLSPRAVDGVASFGTRNSPVGLKYWELAWWLWRFRDDPADIMPSGG